MIEEELNTIDVKRAIKQYLKINNSLEALVLKRANYSHDFYRLHSIVGGMAGNDEAYNSAIRPDIAAIKIITEEATLSKMIERLGLRMKRFDEFLAEIDRNELEKAVNLEDVSPIEQEAFEFITELEYYLTNHAIERLKKRNERLIELGIVSMEEELNVNRRMKMYEVVESVEHQPTSKLLSEVKSYEASLFEKLEELLA